MALLLCPHTLLICLTLKKGLAVDHYYCILHPLVGEDSLEMYI